MKTLPGLWPTPEPESWKIRPSGKPLIILLRLAFIMLAWKCAMGGPHRTGAVASAAVSITKAPLFLDSDSSGLLTVGLSIAQHAEPLQLQQITLRFTRSSGLNCISNLRVYYCGPEPGNSTAELFGSSSAVSETTPVNGIKTLGPGTHVFRVIFGGNPGAGMLSKFEFIAAVLDFNKQGQMKILPAERYTFHVARTLRAPGQDGCDTYRIPCLATTNNGTLIAVYDNRYLGSNDLQGHIDIGMSRSTDGGNTWEPMKVIMDMGEWGGKSQAENGIGDPSVLYDPFTGTLWVAALWAHGNPGKMTWFASGPGLEPEATGQFMLVKSNDDGLTWSEPVSITRQSKNPEWYLFFQGPGKGICMRNGTLVFPAQFKDKNQVPHSTIVYSSDHGITWTAGTGAKPNTTEAQVVELPGGTLMLNMRDDLNRTDKGPTNGRAIALTRDMGKTWTTAPGSNSALPEPNCMASLISAKLKVKGKCRQVLFFSNPNDRSRRIRMTIKASLDHGLTWPEKYQYEINAAEGFGYSCLTMVDSNTIGILYEGKKSLIFQKIPLKQLLK